MKNKEFKVKFFTILLLILLLFLCLLVHWNNSVLLLIDKKVFAMVSSIRNNFLNSLFTIITHLGDTFFICLILIGLLLLKNKKQIGFPLSIVMLLNVVFNYFIKQIVQRPRPQEILPLIDLPNSFSFPSGHAQASILFYATLFFLIAKFSKKKKPLAFMVMGIVLGMVIGFSRVYLGVHYFSDVIGGFLIGIVLIINFVFVTEQKYKKMF